MGTGLWQELRSRLGAAPAGDRCIAVQSLVLSDSDVGVVQAMLDKAGEQLSVSFRLSRDHGDIVLLDAALTARMSPQLINAFKDERPVLVIGGSRSDDERQLSVAERFERRQHELLRQLRKMALVRKVAAEEEVEASRHTRQDDPDNAYDSGFDSRLDLDELLADELQTAQGQMLRQACRGWREPDTPLLAASYGPGAGMVFDFRQRVARFDAVALQHLRARRELPRPVSAVSLGFDATTRDLRASLWDLGVAGAALPLIDAPHDWWHAPITATATASAESCTLVPRYLDLMRRLGTEATTPSTLRRAVRVGAPDLRRVLQAALVSGQAHWTSPHPAQEKL